MDLNSFQAQVPSSATSVPTTKWRAGPLPWSICWSGNRILTARTLPGWKTWSLWRVRRGSNAGAFRLPCEQPSSSVYISIAPHLSVNSFYFCQLFKKQLSQVVNNAHFGHNFLFSHNGKMFLATSSSGGNCWLHFLETAFFLSCYFLTNWNRERRFSCRTFDEKCQKKKILNMQWVTWSSRCNREGVFLLQRTTPQLNSACGTTKMSQRLVCFCTFYAKDFELPGLKKNSFWWTNPVWYDLNSAKNAVLEKMVHKFLAWGKKIKKNLFSPTSVLCNFSG